MATGELITIHPDGRRERRPISDDNEASFLETMQAVVGGYIEIVPGFDSIKLDGKRCACIAFANEDGKLARPQPLPYNEFATAEWHCTVAHAGVWAPYVPDFLVGSIAVVIGDDLLRSMREDGP